MLDLKKILENLKTSADWVGLRHVAETSHLRFFRDAKPQVNHRRFNEGVMVEVSINGHMGYCATNQLTFEGIQAAVKVAEKQAKIASKWAIFSFNPHIIRPPVVGNYQSPVEKSALTIPPSELNDLLIQICHHLKVSDRVVVTTAMAEISEVRYHFVSSNGADIEQLFSFVATDYAATAQDGNIVQKRSDNGYLARCYQAGREVFEASTLFPRVRQIGEEAVELLFAQDCPNINTTLVLAPDQMMLQIHESVGHPLEIDRILGDERNYAGGSFVKPSDFGKLVYGSPLMNITFAPTVEGEIASYAFDDAGIKAEKQYLIKDGILLRGLGSIESQIRSKIPGVANFRACSWNRPPIDRMANLNLESGDSSFDDIISSIEHGVYMKSNRSWSIDDYRHKFQFGCEYAKLIENGKITKTLRNPNYRGTTLQFWHSLIAVGDDSTREIYGSPFCGKGEPNQAIRVGHASPVCAFKEVEVFSG